MDSFERLRAEVSALPEAEQRELARTLPAPKADESLTKIWLTLLLILAGIIFFFGFLGYLQLRADPEKDADLLFAPVTLAVGALIGLFAPSPVK